METKTRHIIEFETYADSSALPPEDAALLRQARNATKDAYAPYSRFRVGAAALLESGEVLTGTNQENASYPVGICAERTVLSAASSLYPNLPVLAIAVSYDNELAPSTEPIAPCGICRQTLVEYTARFSRPIRLILAGLTGKVIVVADSADLMPLSFSAKSMK